MKTIVITGASSGIGAALKKNLESEGAKVYNIDIKGGDLTADISCDEGRKLASDTVAREFPDGIDGLVCCAGVSPDAMNIPKLLSLNYYGAVYMAQALLPLLELRRGSCVLISSMAIAQGYSIKKLVSLMLTKDSEKAALGFASTLDAKNLGVCTAVYATAKYAVSLWVRRHAALWGARGVHINCVAPGTTNTPMVSGMSDAAMSALSALQIPIKYRQSNMLEPDEVADVIAFLLSKQSRAVHGALLFVDGGTEPAINTEHVY